MGSPVQQTRSAFHCRHWNIESHAISFAYIAYASAYLKRFYPAAFLTGLIRAQPMGFYSVNTLINDARRHGVRIHPVHINHSAAITTLDGRGQPAARNTAPADWGSPGPTVRLGLDQVRGISDTVAERIAAGQPYTSITDLARRARLTETHLENLATAGALTALGPDRRQALWMAAPAAANTDTTIDGTIPVTAPMLPGMSDAELTAANLQSTGSSVDSHPIQHIRHHLDAHGAVRIGQLPTIPDRTRVLVGGIVTHRQAPETAGGVLFVNLEDETGQANVVCEPGLRVAYPREAHAVPALLIRGRLRNADGVVSLTADKLTPLHTPAAVKGRNFR
ncbi:OB-fold nucleic acid binding domain-containing protein [Stackebrandtia nassauensis]|uniref:helix-hairpin-helix domain-containing protein n=1 Tax=Stackebrandtia nassauensis TaxID=283811 RepID=UPI0001A39733|nr:OB-fold nucleic acid binding domain-containing protein [Stackebrandtia nassauensis]